MVAVPFRQALVEPAAFCLGVWLLMKLLMRKAEVIMEAIMVGSAGTESVSVHGANSSGSTS
jgi:hypothetical protein